MEKIISTYSDIQKNLEALSLEIVLADPADPMAFKTSLGLLKEIHILAKKKGNANVAGQASDAAKLIQKIRKNDVDQPAAMDQLADFITRMKSLAGQENSPLQDVETHPPTQKLQQGAQHPGALPEHLSMEDFEFFLSSKIPVLEELESLILEFESGNLKEPAMEMKRLIHTMKGECGFLSLTDAEHLCHRTEDLLLMEVTADFADPLLRVKDWFQETFSAYAQGRTTGPDSQDILKLLDNYETRLYSMASEPPQKNDPTHDEPRESNGHPVTNAVKRPVQIDSQRLDHLIDIIGELAIAQSMVSRGVHQDCTGDKSFGHALKALEETTKALQKIGLSLRMVPLKPLFNRMKRVARDLAKKQNKKINFIIQGESTELDKNLVDGLADPLIHIVRNSIDHGIESDPRERKAAGKSETARIGLKGFQKGDSLYIEISDDGRGINQEELIKKAISAGIVEDPDRMDKAAVLNLIFRSGLSTAAQVTDISGRGIGMDVVRTAVSQFNGTLSVDSQIPKGTCVTIKLPLTLAIMEGMVISTQSNIKKGRVQHYVIPTLSIVSSINYSPDMVSTAMGKNEFITIREELIPLLDLDVFFNKANQGPCSRKKGIIVIIEDAGLKAGLLIKELVAKQSFIRKPLTGLSGNIPGISGATILANGEVCLILDTAALVSATLS